MPQLLFICGLPGSGKSTLGKKIANKLKFKFIDLDNQIQIDTGFSPAHWISAHSDEIFRKKESESLRKINFEEDTVVSCGGGTPCFEGNLNWMLQHGTCIYLDVPEGMVLKRLQQGEPGTRPLIDKADPLSSLRVLIEKRKDCYARIPHKIEAHKVSFPDLMSWIFEILNLDQPK